jgi:anthranilate phosphoribosyltransferase
MTRLNPFLRIVANGQTLSEEQASEAMVCLFEGEASPEEIAGFLLGLRGRGETIDELTGFTRVMRERALSVSNADDHAVDLCGTGGDGARTFNISTAAAIVVAGAGVTVAKHGNRSVSSSSGSADVLEALGVKTALGVADVERCLKEAGIAFMFAPLFHPAMKYVMPVRRALGVRTFFNVLGPLCNPAGVRRQLTGAFNLETAERMAAILARLGAERAYVAHSHDGLDEVSLAGPTTIFAVENGSVERREVTPADFDLDPQPVEALTGDGARVNASIIRDILRGGKGAARDIVVLNAAFAIHASGRVESLAHGFNAATASIDSGDAARALDRLVHASNARAAEA